MSWNLIAAIGILVALLAARMQLRGWIYARWEANEMTDRNAKVVLGLLAVGPLVALGVWAATITPFPWNLLVLGLVILTSAPMIAATGASLDHTSRYVLKRGSRSDADR